MSMTAPALGSPGRVSMTPAMQADYRRLVAAFGLPNTPFRCVDAAEICAVSRGSRFNRLEALEERGWLLRAAGQWRLSLPIMQFRPVTRSGAKP